MTDIPSMSDQTINLKVYMAGPSVFLDDAITHARQTIQTCTLEGLLPLHPLDELIAETDKQLPPRDRSPQDWYLADLALIDQSAGIIADITAFRGPYMDSGTAFEIGYAVGKGKEVVLWSETGHLTEKDRVLALGEGGKGKWGVLDDFGATENLMICRPDTPVYANLRDAARKMRDLLERRNKDS
ncbi:MAG: hypothetical protein Q9160_006054 [Pyrenula sp. 1 TL-2023]